MEMKQKEQEINKRKKKIIMEGKTNERDSLKCNEPSRKRDF